MAMLEKYKKYTMAREEGFTLIELLVVIVIIGVLAAIALPIFMNQQKAAADTALKSDMRNVALAYQTWKVTNPTGAYPDYFAGWINAVNDTPLNSSPNTWKNFDVSLSENTRIHAFDYGSYNASTVGQSFCIQGANGTAGSYSGLQGVPNSRLMFSSTKGGFTPSC